MKIRPCSRRSLLEACSLEDFAYQLDTYVGCEHRCCYCYALNQAETDWAQEILIHEDLVDKLQHELSGISPQTIYIGCNSDPYQPAERTHGQTRQTLEVLAEREFSACILTKSDLVVRDIDLLAGMPEASAGISLAFQNDDDRRLFEAETPSNNRRVDALKRLKAAGVDTYALICPVMPLITDVEVLAKRLAPYINTLWVYALSMEAQSDPNWQNVRRILSRHFADLATEVAQITFSPSHTYWTDLRHQLEELGLRMNLDVRVRL